MSKGWKSKNDVWTEKSRKQNYTRDGFLLHLLLQGLTWGFPLELWFWNSIIIVIFRTVDGGVGASAQACHANAGKEGSTTLSLFISLSIQ